MSQDRFKKFPNMFSAGHKFLETRKEMKSQDSDRCSGGKAEVAGTEGNKA